MEDGQSAFRDVDSLAVDTSMAPLDLRDGAGVSIPDVGTASDLRSPDVATASNLRSSDVAMSSNLRSSHAETASDLRNPGVVMSSDLPSSAVVTSSKLAAPEANAPELRTPSIGPAKLLKPNWLKVKAPGGENYLRIKDMLGELKLATVCQEARCPNMGECWGGGTATFMLMGEVCTRGCRFCNVKTGNPKGKIDNEEPEKVGWAIAQMGLEYVVLTSVDRDDLPDQGADHFGRTIEVIKKNDPKLIVEVLTPDFRGERELVERLVQSKPDVFAHNIETVERLTKKVRDPRATYRQSLRVLEMVKEIDATRYTKSSIMLGLGEEKFEILQTLKDLRGVGCDVVTFGQYLQPTARHLRVETFVTPEDFAEWQMVAEAMGFLYAASGPLVRSSYRAGEFFMMGMVERSRGDGQARHEV